MEHHYIKEDILVDIPETSCTMSSHEPSSALAEAKFKLSPVSGCKEATLKHTASVSRDAVSDFIVPYGRKSPM